MSHASLTHEYDRFGRIIATTIPIPPEVWEGPDDSPGDDLAGGTHEYDRFGRIIATDIPIPPGMPTAFGKAADASLDRHNNMRRRLALLTLGSAPASRSQSSVMRVRADENGQFRVTADINGQAIEMLVDTGATTVLLTYDDALRAGISVRPPNFTLVASTCNGNTRMAPVVLESITIGEIERRDVEAVVSGPEGQNSLLGMTFLNRLKRVELRGGVLELEA